MDPLTFRRFLAAQEAPPAPGPVRPALAGLFGGGAATPGVAPLRPRPDRSGLAALIAAMQAAFVPPPPQVVRQRYVCFEDGSCRWVQEGNY